MTHPDMLIWKCSRCGSYVSEEQICAFEGPICSICFNREKTAVEVEIIKSGLRSPMPVTLMTDEEWRRHLAELEEAIDNLRQDFNAHKQEFRE